jgi:predicted phosphodiesterase
MRIGIVTDIHDDVARLRAALVELLAAGVDAVVSLGDTSDLHGKGEDVAGVAAALQAAGAVGVWGNHDFGLCRDVAAETAGRFPAATLAYLATMRPRLELAGCHFSHVEPWLDGEKLEDLWCFEGQPDEPDRLSRSFSAVPHRAAFMGHFHRWLAATEDGKLAWDGTAPLTLEPGRRYLVVVGPLFRGDFAILDTDRWVLEPRRLAHDPHAP